LSRWLPGERDDGAGDGTGDGTGDGAGDGAGDGTGDGTGMRPRKAKECEAKECECGTTKECETRVAAGFFVWPRGEAAVFLAARSEKNFTKSGSPVACEHHVSTGEVRERRGLCARGAPRVCWT
jgi:hypothetical protein